LIQQSEKCLWIGAVALDIRVVLSPVLDQLERGRFHHVIGHDVNVDVYDRLHRVPSFAAIG
jgi:hypothetical protein